MHTELTGAEREALGVLALGICSRAGRTEVDERKGIRAVKGSVATRLIALKLARNVPGWNAVELTDAGRHELARAGG